MALPCRERSNPAVFIRFYAFVTIFCFTWVLIFIEFNKRYGDSIQGSTFHFLSKRHGPKRKKPDYGQQCPLAVQKNSGLFMSSSSSVAKDNFQDVVLLVACNFAYYDMLQNWEYLARRLNLKWVVLALDEELYNKLGPERAISPGELSVSGPQLWRQGEFNKLACNKMRMVLSVSQSCGLDVVFSDVDNIFYENPFLHDLGRLIESQRYDYIYQPNHRSTGGMPRTDRCLLGNLHEEGNTGFYFLNRKSDLLKNIFNATLERCEDPKNKLDDQTLFWEELWKFFYGPYHNHKFHHCTLPEYGEPSTFELKASQDAEFNFCCMDPFFYPIGDGIPLNPAHPVTYHANFVLGKDKKVEKLMNSRWDHFGWNNSRIID